MAHLNNTLAAARSSFRDKWRGKLAVKELDYLLCLALGISHWQIYAQELLPVSENCLRRLNSLAQRRAGGVPLAYLSGKKEFYSLEFNVTPATLTPRPESEMLVEFAVRNMPLAAKLLELGCGGGAVSIAIAHSRPDLQITAIDISSKALQAAAGNVRKHGCRVRLLRSDWFSRLPRRKIFHCIAANVPYLSAGEAAAYGLRHEPKLALAAKENGLACLRGIVRQAPFYLQSGGLIALEHAPWQKLHVAKMAAAAGFRNLRCLKDLGGLFRMTIGKIGRRRVWRPSP